MFSLVPAHQDCPGYRAVKQVVVVVISEERYWCWRAGGKGKVNSV